MPDSWELARFARDGAAINPGQVPRPARGTSKEPQYQGDDLIQIMVDDPSREDVQELLGEHLEDMYAASPAGSVHALDHAALTGPGITFWTARRARILLGCGALKELTPTAAELKSMCTTASSRGQGVATRLLAVLIEEASQRGYRRLYLETGALEFFAPARRLYSKYGFTQCEPFASYRPDPNSVFMTLGLPAISGI
jgi:putative acetyltransferase